ncbi:CAF17-like 4Fe-4S cluster assembly/insertion protein YgfZ [Halalkalicoccus jeotgali]|uniref:Aminomethyltransferase n=1 Tax=Halalkalicoccus jeotgali (strain DSM 18796 / CECT 7217 / JCM 14584 / KCTC 4019 / B3) TaxID=795797 RepID=D8J7S4_HALJB|nr:aminomethyltransferase family protein [Halalkalicoccus jeotgali]ADJ16094.1 aminomethyltransferase [Halalkalicoccus jeotgali B3]ELY38189.1 aminomethyltransferase [Halalkalicoccus jeotgali B3]
MTVLETFHANHGATFEERGGRRLARHYGRPERTHLAVRNGVGITEMAYGVLVITGDDRVEYVDNVVSNRVPDDDGEGAYALLCDPQGRIELDIYVYNAGERLLLFVPPGRARGLAEEWREKVFIQDVEIEVASDDLAVLGVHGPKATEKVASVLNKIGVPEGELVFDRGTINDIGVTVIASDDPTGEDGYEIVCSAAESEAVMDALINYGTGAIPFGSRTWETLTLEAGTPLFSSELEGRVPNVLGLRNAVDFEKGCFVGQEVISRVENRGQPSQRLVGLRCSELPAAGTAVLGDDETVGEITRAVQSPSLSEPIALALVEFGLESEDVTVGDESVPATVTELPFVEGSGRSARVPFY